MVSNSSITKDTTVGVIDNYIKFLQNAFVFYEVKRYDIKGKEHFKTKGKYYIADIGLRNHLLGLRNRDRGHILENIVFMELRNRGYEISIGKISDNEIDFIATKVNEKKYIQVVESMAQSATRTRELVPLKTVRDNYEKIILTTDRLFSNTDKDCIKNN